MIAQFLCAIMVVGVLALIGAGATLLIVDAAHSAADPLYTVTDPLYEDFER